ncbi:trimeric LpxA-like protein, partial [Anaeromyces robustus]
MNENKKTLKKEKHNQKEKIKVKKEENNKQKNKSINIEKKNLKKKNGENENTENNKNIHNKRKSSDINNNNKNNKKTKVISEKNKLLEGKIYDFNDEELTQNRIKCRKLLKKFNNLEPDDNVKREKYLKKIFKKVGKNLEIVPPLYCDYGWNITIGDCCTLHTNTVILDCAEVTIGNNCLFSPGCQLIAVTQTLDYKSRQSGKEYGKPIKIGNDCFFGAGSIICPGVTIGDRVIVGAGTVV